MWDVDGKEYVDHLLGQGPNFFGHAPPSIIEAVSDAIGRGIIFGAQHPLELEAAERMLSVLGWPDLIRFGLTGTEAVQAAIRLAGSHRETEDPAIRRAIPRLAGQCPDPTWSRRLGVGLGRTTLARPR